MPQQEIAVVLKAVADKASTSRAAKEMQDQIGKEMSRKGNAIGEVDIRYWRKISDEIVKLNKNLQQMNGMLEKLVKGGTPGTSGGGGGGGTGNPGGGGGGGTGIGGIGGSGGDGGFFRKIGDANARQLMSSLMSMFLFSRLWNYVSNGRDLIRSEEDLASRLGTRIGGYGSDFRKTRLEFNATANQYAYTNMEAMRAADIYMSLAGTKNLQQNLAGILYASRGWGMDQNNVAAFFGSYGKMGGTNVKQFAEELTAAINKSGMRGRENELLGAVKQLAESAYQTQLSVKDQQWNNIAGLLTFFAQSNPALKGEKGKEVVGGLDDMMRKGLNNPELLAIMGYGSKYKGMKGLWELQTRLSHGITDNPQLLKDLYTGLDQWFADPWSQREFLLQNTNLSPDEIDAIMNPTLRRKVLSGQITTDQLRKLLKGGDLSKRVQDWMNSNAGTNAQWNVYNQNVNKSASDRPDQMQMKIEKEIMKYVPSDVGGAVVDTLLGVSGIHTAISAWKYLKKWFGGGGGKPPTPKSGGGGKPPTPKGGGGGNTPPTGATGGTAEEGAIERGAIQGATEAEGAGTAAESGGILETIWSALVDLLELLGPAAALAKGKTGNMYAKANPQLMHTAMTYAYGYGSQNFVPAFGWGSVNIRTLEARKNDLLQKEWNVLQKKEQVLNKENASTTASAAGNQATLSLLEKVSYRLSDGMKDAIQQVSYASTNAMANVVQLAFHASGGGMGGLTTVSYGGGGGSFLTMPLNDNFNMSPAQVDAWINQHAPKGSAMRGMGAAFVEAARRTGLDVRYLVAHAALETGWGTSRIAKTKHNFFGIGAVDWNPYGGAYSFGNSAADGIIAGAEWIAQNFTNRGQNTLYSMLHGGTHSYASDQLWDEKIANIMATAPIATVNVKVSGGIEGLTYTNNDLVARSIANSFQKVDLSRVFMQGQRGTWV